MNIKNTPSRHHPQELPYSSYPTLSFPSFYYKIKNRIDPSRHIVLVGLQLHKMKRVQEDHFFQLLQIFNNKYPRIRIHIILPNLLYGQIKIDVMDVVDVRQDFIEVQGKLFQLLQAFHIYFTQFIKTFFDESFLFSQQFDSEVFVSKFMENVVTKVKEKERTIFGPRKKKNQ